MAVVGQAAVRDWVNGRADLVGAGNPLDAGAYTREQRSPAYGAYVVVTRNSEGTTSIVEEPAPEIGVARIQFLVYAGTEVAAENAAVMLRKAVEGLQGAREACGSSGVTVLAADNWVGPLFVPHVGDTGEEYCFQVNADFVLAEL